MHTPASIVTGIVFAPLGLVLVFTAAITPQWREGQARLGRLGTGVREARGIELLLLRSDGLWESCLQVVHSNCGSAGLYLARTNTIPVSSPLGDLCSSLFLCGSGIVLASIGARCWTDTPLRNVAGAGGLLVALAGVLSLAALSIYTHHLPKLGVELISNMSDFQGLDLHKLPSLTLHPAGSLYFGWVGAWVQVLGGLALLFGVGRPRCPVRAKQLRREIVMTAYDVSC